jgi:hypothetical protein
LKIVYSFGRIETTIEQAKTVQESREELLPSWRERLGKQS